MNIGTVLTHYARYRPDQLAVVFEDHRLTYRVFNQRVNRLAHALTSLGLTKGDKLAVILPNCLELLELYWACAKTGIVVVPLSPLLRGSGLITLLRDPDAVLVISNANMVGTLEAIKPELANVPADRYMLIDAPDTTGYHDYHTLTAAASDHELQVELTDHDLYSIFYSSGTTGLPKGVVYTHYIWSLQAMLFAGAFAVTPKSVVLHTGLLVFSGASIMLLPAMYQGATFILHPRFEANAFIETVARERVTHVIMVPSQIIALLHSPSGTAEQLQSLETLCSAGAPLHREHKDELNRRLPGVFSRAIRPDRGLHHHPQPA